MFEPSSVEADTTVTVTLTLELPEGTNEVVVPVPDSFTIFGCTAPTGWTCWTSALGSMPASMTVARDGGEGQSVAVAMELRTPTAGGEYAFGDAVLVVTGGFEGGPTTTSASGDDPVVGEASAGETIVDSVTADDGATDNAAPAVVAAVLLVGVGVAAYRARRARS